MTDAHCKTGEKVVYGVLPLYNIPPLLLLQAHTSLLPVRWLMELMHASLLLVLLLKPLLLLLSTQFFLTSLYSSTSMQPLDNELIQSGFS